MERFIDGIDGIDINDPGLGDAKLPEEMIENEDGSVTLLDPEEQAPKQTQFLDNLAESLDQHDLNSISLDLLEKIEIDKQSRSKRDEQYEEGIQRTGLGDDAPGGAEFSGASKVVHPVLAEVCVDFASSAIRELFPPSGPVRTKICGKENQQKREIAERKSEYLNWQLTQQISEYRENLEQRLSQVPLGGSQYQKFFYDTRLGRPAEEFVPVDEVYLPYHATNFYTASRFTHAYRISRQTFEERVESGLYRDIGAIVDPGDLESSASAQASNKVEGKEEGLAYDQDGMRLIYETYCYYRIEDDAIGKGRWAPYIITIDLYSEKVLAVYRNWEENDKRLRKLDWVVEWGFIPWRGAYKLGLIHLIGSLSAAATGALRALLDSAHINNTASAVKLKGGRTSGQNLDIAVTQVAELEAPAGVDDIRKLVMPMPFNPPSPVLFQLLGWLTEAAKGVASTATEKIADGTSNMPVGTTLALIEQGSKIYSAIHARLHASQERALKILCRLNRDFPPDQQELMDTFGEQIVQPGDFNKNDDIQPVSDPSIFSDTQRYARWQAVLQMMGDQSVPWNRLEIYRDGLKLLKVDDADRYLPAIPEPVTADPVQENIGAVMQGAQLKANQQQDHLAHLHEHLRFLVDPMQGANPVFGGPQLQTILKHCMEHLMMLYDVTSHTMASAISSMMGMQAPPDTLVAEAADKASQINMPNLQPLLQMFQQASQLVQQKMPPQPMDPVKATSDAALAQTKQRAEAEARKFDVEMRKLDVAQQKAAEEQAYQAKVFQDTFRQSMEEQQRSFMVELEKLRQAQQEIQLLAEKQSAERDLKFHELLSQLAERSAQQSAVAAPTQPEMPDLTPHIDRIEKLVGQQSQDQHGAAMAAALQGIQQLLQQGAQRPNKLVRDEKGDAVGMVFDPNFGNQIVQ